MAAVEVDVVDKRVQAPETLVVVRVEVCTELGQPGPEQRLVKQAQFVEPVQRVRVDGAG